MDKYHRILIILFTMQMYIVLALILFQSCYLDDSYIIAKYLITQFNRSQRIINSNNVNDRSVEIYLNDEKVDFRQFILFPKEGEYTILFNFTKNLTSMDHLFYQCESLVSIDLSNFYASDVVYMDSTFSGCKNLQTVILDNFDARKVTYMGGLFRGCTSLVSLDLSTFRTSAALTDTRNMFENCASLRYLNLDNFDTRNVLVMYYMFIGCKSLETLDLSSFNTMNVQK